MANETTVKIKYEPDTASLAAASNAAGKAIEQGISKATPDVKININTQAIDVASNAIQSIHNRMQMLPNISKTAENQITKSFEKVGQAMNKLESGKMSPEKFQKTFDNMVQYANESVTKAENQLQGKKIKGPKVEVSEVDTKPAENALMSAFANIGKVLGGKVMMNMAKGMLDSISGIGAEIGQLQINLSSMLGSDQIGEDAFNYLSQLAMKIPGEVTDIIPAYNALVNRGIYPTEQAMGSLSQFALSQGKDIARLSEAIAAAQMNNFMRLRQFGVIAQKNGDKLIMNFRGQRTEIKNNEQAIFDYIQSLGNLPGMAEAAAKKMRTLKGQQDKINDSINMMKYTVYKELEKTLVPIFEKMGDIVDNIRKWVEANPQLATTITVVVIATLALVGAVIALTGAIAVLETIGAPVIAIIALIMLYIGALVFVVWDLYNGLTNGNSYILAAIDAFLEWAGVSWTVQDAIDWITKTLNDMITYFQEVVLPIWEQVWNVLAEIVGAILDWLGGYIGACINIWVGLFTGNIPKAKQGFVSLAKGIASIFLKIGAAAAKLVSYILRIFSKGIAKLANMAKDIPFVGDAMAGLSSFVDSGADAVEGFSLDMGSMGDDWSFGTQVEENRAKNAGKERFKWPGGKKPGKGGLPTGGGGSGKDGKGGKGGKGKKHAGGGDDKDALDKATIIAIEGIEDVLKKMGYSLEKEIKRADLFMAQREAMKEMMMTKDKTGIIDTYNTIREKRQQEQGDIDNSNVTQDITIYLNGDKNTNNSKFNIKKSTTLEDILNINRKVTGG